MFSHRFFVITQEIFGDQESLLMNRRDFVALAAGLIPMAAMAQEGDSRRPGQAMVVRAGHSLADEVLQLGDRSFLHFKVTTRETDGNGLIIEQSQIRRFGPPRHVHFEQDEWFYPLEGTFIVEVGEGRYELHPGDFLFAPRAVPHAWKHVEEEAGRMLIGFQPAGTMEAFFRKFTKGGVMPTVEELPALFLEHGMKVVGPPL
jgi:quercetin dioxygenase-like cupin family protein